MIDVLPTVAKSVVLEHVYLGLRRGLIENNHGCNYVNDESSH